MSPFWRGELPGSTFFHAPDTTITGTYSNSQLFIQALEIQAQVFRLVMESLLHTEPSPQSLGLENIGRGPSLNLELADVTRMAGL